MRNIKTIGKQVLALLLTVSCASLTFPTTVSFAEEVTESSERHYGHVEVPGELPPESIYKGPDLNWGSSSIPAAYDSRDYGNVTSVKDQNPFGSCWSFTTVAALESSLLSQDIYNTIDLSEYHLVYYNFNSVADPLGGISNDAVSYSDEMQYALDAGGNVTVAYHALTNWVGAVDEKNAPYPASASNVESLPLTTENAYLNDIVHVQQVYKINKTDTAAIKQCIMDYGAVTTSYYHDDIYLNGDAYYNNVNTSTNHAVTIVGWDDNYSMDNFKTSPGADGAWLVKNSWDTWFGDEGYFWLSYKDTSIYSTMCVLIGENADNYDNNYQYDGSYMSSHSAAASMEVANVFTVPDGECAESLDAVAFEVVSTNVDYSIQIYTDMTDASDPTSGTPMLEEAATGNVLYQGYHTIKLPESVLLQPNQTFSVVVGLSCKYSDTVTIPMECDNTWDMAYGTITYDANAEAGQSFIKRAQDYAWIDVGAQLDSNLRVKAFTTNTNTGKEVSVTEVSVTPEAAEIFVDETVQLSATVLPENARNKEVSWSSSDDTIASVDTNGLVTAHKKGEAVITCTTADGGYTDTVSISVKNPLVASVSVTPEDAELFVGETVQLSATVLPELADNKEVTWSSSDDTIASVDASGLVTAHKKGEAVITCTTADGGYTDTASISVKNPLVASVSVTPKDAEIFVGETVQLSANVLPALADNKAVTWSSSDDTVASVDANGLVTAHKKGEAEITVTTVDGAYTDTATITVKNPLVASVSVTPESAELYVGETVQLSATVLPELADNKNVTWSSSDDTIATVDVNGLVTAYKKGETVITCTTADGSYTDTATITVREITPVVEITLVADAQKLLVGDTIQLTINVNGTEQPVSVNSEYDWSVTPTGVVEVSESGLVTGLGVGKATVTCTHKENPTHTASIEMTIEIPFTDIKMTDWQYPYVVYAYQNNLMGGKGDGEFDMNGKLTRAEFVTVLYSYSGKPDVTYEQYFADVPDGKWFTNAITWAKQKNVTAGNPDGTFGVYNNINREQLVVMLYGYAKNQGLVDGEVTIDLSAYSDMDKVSTWAREAFSWAVQNNIVSGKTSNNTPILDPKGNATRGECATIMKGFVESTK